MSPFCAHVDEALEARRRKRLSVPVTEESNNELGARLQSMESLQRLLMHKPSFSAEAQLFEQQLNDEFRHFRMCGVTRGCRNRRAWHVILTSVVQPRRGERDALCFIDL